jgi:hypothetical protein
VPSAPCLVKVPLLAIQNAMLEKPMEAAFSKIRQIFKMSNQQFETLKFSRDFDKC